MNKLEGMPTIHYISLTESVKRRTNLEKWFEKSGITNYVPHIFERFEKYNHTLVGKKVHLLAPSSMGPITSHLCLLREWYESSSDPVLFVVEDDLSLETVDYWNFSWSEFVDSLPHNWGCVQLVVIREYLGYEYYLEPRRERDWCAAAYLMTREYVKLVLDTHYPEDKFLVDVKYINYYPAVEHVLFSSKPRVYSFPLFVEDCYNTQSTLISAPPENQHATLFTGQGEFHHLAHDCVIDWWKKTGFKLKPQDICSMKYSPENFNFLALKEKYQMDISGVIHVGAHHGQEVKDYVTGGVEKIVLFEPLKYTFMELQRTVNNFEAEFHMHNVGLGSQNMRATMYISDNEAQSSSLLLPKVHLDHHPNVNFPWTEEVDIRTLDQYGYKDCNYLHINVQGYELEVLKGSVNTLKHVKYVYCEVNREEVYEGNAYVEEIDEFLRNYGLERIETSWMGDIWGDALYVKSIYRNPKLAKSRY